MTGIRRRLHRRVDTALAQARSEAHGGRPVRAYFRACGGLALGALLLALGGPPEDTL